jgi:glutathione synthase/RimK-type ligase-like ATP-grasp enzyme
MPNLKLAPYNLASGSARGLAELLGCLMIRPDRTTYRYRDADRVINWGRSTAPFPCVANRPNCVALAVDKRRTLQKLTERGVPTLTYSLDAADAIDWLRNGYRVYVRTTTHGRAGQGIVVVNSIDELAQHSTAPLYTRGFATEREFRIHVAFGQVLEVLQKRRRNGTHPDPLVRSHGDWVFCRNNLRPYPEALTAAALHAVSALDLDFGGVDVALDRLGAVAVLEVNTAPGLEGSSLPLYANAFRDHLHA